MSNTFGHTLKVTTFGESHGTAIGAVIDGIPEGVSINLDDIACEMRRRKPGQGPYSSSRKEDDQVEILSGLQDEKTLGTPLTLLIKNKDQKSSDYQAIKDCFRPGHADFTYFKKYGFIPLGGGRASGRETATRVAAGAIAKCILKNFKPLNSDRITFSSYSSQIGPIKALKKDLEFAKKDPLCFCDPDLVSMAHRAAQEAKDQLDSIGGIVELVINGVPPGIGEPVFQKLDATLAFALTSIGSVKGVEFGDGFELSRMKGSESNDQMENGKFLTNHAGGILGGISTGEPIIIRLSVKPTPSIGREQKSITTSGENRLIKIDGRHDVCLCPRIGPVAEAMASLVLCDFLLTDYLYRLHSEVRK